MQRESAEELVLMSKHGRPSRHPIQYGAEIATVNLFNFEIHLFVAQIEDEADIRPWQRESSNVFEIPSSPVTLIISKLPSNRQQLSTTRISDWVSIPRQHLRWPASSEGFHPKHGSLPRLHGSLRSLRGSLHGSLRSLHGSMAITVPSTGQNWQLHKIAPNHPNATPSPQKLGVLRLIDCDVHLVQQRS
jgi:hypothetical protein